MTATFLHPASSRDDCPAATTDPGHNIRTVSVQHATAQAALLCCDLKDKLGLIVLICIHATGAKYNSMHPISIGSADA